MYNFRDAQRLPQGIGTGEAQVFNVQDDGVDLTEVPKLQYNRQIREEEQAREQQKAALKAEADRIKSIPNNPTLDLKGVNPAQTKVLNEAYSAAYKEVQDLIEQAQRDPSISNAQIEKAIQEKMGVVIAATEDSKTNYKMLTEFAKKKDELDPFSKQAYEAMLNENTYKGMGLGDMGAWDAGTLSKFAFNPPPVDLKGIYDIKVGNIKGGDAYITEEGVRTPSFSKFSPEKARLAAEAKYETLSEDQKATLEAKGETKEKFVDIAVRLAKASAVEERSSNLSYVNKGGAGGKGGFDVSKGMENYIVDKKDVQNVKREKDTGKEVERTGKFEEFALGIKKDSNGKLIELPDRAFATGAIGDTEEARKNVTGKPVKFRINAKGEREVDVLDEKGNTKTVPYDINEAAIKVNYGITFDDLESATREADLLLDKPDGTKIKNTDVKSSALKKAIGL
jgi:hypothetical protein